jgi:hypothetical protein
VLTAINNREKPAERDVLLLRAYCPEIFGPFCREIEIVLPFTFNRLRFSSSA